MKRLAALSAMLGLVLAASSSGSSIAAQADATSFRLDSTIAFTSTRDNPAGEIYLMNPDGTEPRRLTVNTDGDAFPVFPRTVRS